MNCVMSVVRCTNQIIHVENTIVSVFYIINSYWINVMNKGPDKYLSAGYSEITTTITHYYVVTNLLPLP